MHSGEKSEYKTLAYSLWKPHLILSIQETFLSGVCNGQHTPPHFYDRQELFLGLGYLKSRVWSWRWKPERNKRIYFWPIEQGEVLPSLMLRCLLLGQMSTFSPRDIFFEGVQSTSKEMFTLKKHVHIH